MHLLFSFYTKLRTLPSLFKVGGLYKRRGKGKKYKGQIRLYQSVDRLVRKRPNYAGRKNGTALKMINHFKSVILRL